MSAADLYMKRIANTCVASRKIQSVAVAMRISEAVATAAVRTYTLAVEHKFTKGKARSWSEFASTSPADNKLPRTVSC